MAKTKKAPVKKVSKTKHVDVMSFHFKELQLAMFEKRAKDDFTFAQAAAACGMSKAKWYHMESGRYEPNCTSLGSVLKYIGKKASDFIY